MNAPTRPTFPTRNPDLEVWVAGAPVTVNHYQITAGTVSNKRGRRKFNTSEADAWVGLVFEKVHNAVIRQRTALRPPLAVAMTFINVTGDTDNYCKATSDAIQAATGINDKHYHTLLLHKQQVPKHPKGALIALWSGESEAA